MGILRAVLVVGVLGGGYLSHEVPKWCEVMSAFLAVELQHR